MGDWVVKDRDNNKPWIPSSDLQSSSSDFDHLVEQLGKFLLIKNTESRFPHPEELFFRSQYKNTELRVKTKRLMFKMTNQWYFTYYLPWWNCVSPWELFLPQIQLLTLLCYHGDANQGTRQPASCEQVNNKLSSLAICGPQPVTYASFRLCLRSHEI